MQPDPPRLRMTSIERFHLLDDQPAWPNWIGMILNLDGEIDPALAHRSFEVMFGRHSMVASRIDSGLAHWVADPDNGPLVQVIQCDDIDNQPLPPRPDISQTAGSMYIAHTDGRRTRFSMLAHHGLCDGLAGMMFIREWLKVYDDLFHGRTESHALEILDPATLANRNRLYLTSREYLAHLWKQPIALFGATKFLFRKFVILGKKVAADDSMRNQVVDLNWPVMRSADIDAVTTGNARRAARQKGVSLNDWLAGCLFEAVFSWLEKHGSGDEAKYVRLIVPINLRSKVDRKMPAANRTTLVQLDRCRTDTMPRVRLMQGIAYELGLIRSWKLDRLFLIAMRVVGCSNFLMRRSARWNKCRATTLLTNLGKPLLGLGLEQDSDQCLKTGNLVLTSMDLVPPVKNGMPVSFAVHQYRKCLRISMQYDSAALSEPAAMEILHEFSARIASTET